MEYAAIINSPIGHLGIKINKDNPSITGIDFLKTTRSQKTLNHPLIKNTVTELENYFSNPHFKFTIPLQADGTELQKKVWALMKKIPVGKTLTYSEIAEQLNTSPRVIGNACRANPIPLFIPCHRIVAKNNIGGFAGAINGELINMKMWLLAHEKY